MIIVTTPRASLRPLSSVIISANFLLDRWKDHIKKAKNKAPKMGQVSDATSCALHRGEEFDQTEDDDHIFSRDGEDEIDVNETIGEKPTVSKKNTIDCTRSSDHRNKLVG